MAAQPQPYVTAEEYLAAERAANRDTEGKHEYYQGEVYAMAGASRKHNLLVKNLIVGLDTRVGDACNVYPSDMRVHVFSNGLYTYPDIAVTCGEEFFLPDAYLDTLLNPLVLIEVISGSTDSYDREGKFLLYRGIPSLRQYLLVDSQRVHILCITRREADTWSFREYARLTDQIQLSALKVEIRVGEVYRKVTFPAADSTL